MFSAIAHKSLAAAEGYFVEHLTQNDYYASGEIRPGQWSGLGAERLGLHGEVRRDQFNALCENRHPRTDERLTLRQNEKDKRRVFFDFTCSAPKSVSVLAVTLDDQRLVEAHENAAKIAFRELETFAATRVRKAGMQCDRTTGNLVAGMFIHNSSRALDPQLHSHFTVFNATFDGSEKRWKALQAGPMYEAIRYATAVYRNELARSVREVGYCVVPGKYGFEIEGVSDVILRRFSKRAQEVKKIVAEMEEKLGRKLSNNEVSHAVHRSRSKKLRGVSTREVRERQLAQLSGEELQSLRTVTTLAKPRKTVSVSENEQAAVEYAVAHVFERRSVVPEHELLNAALLQRPGELDLSRLKQKLHQSAELIRTDRGLSAHRILETELSLIQNVNAGCDSVAPLHPGYKLAGWLSEDQRRALLHVLRTRDRIVGLRGLAGTGKTTALRELVPACKAAGIEPIFCAPTAAATEILRKEGFDALTLQRLLQSKSTLSERHLIVLDEAGAVGIEDMKRLFDLVKNSRIVLSGDTGQHASVAAGDALRILEQHSSLQSGQLTYIRRQQRAEYRRAVELAAQKRTTEAFQQLERIGSVKEIPAHQLHDSATAGYLNARKQGRQALLVAPTWSEIEAVTHSIRTALRASGVLSAIEKEFQVFDSFSWTEAQRQDVRQYRSGMALRFHAEKGGFERGEMAAVTGAGDSVSVQRTNGLIEAINPARLAKHFDVGESRTLKIAAGDRLLLQSNAMVAGHRFVNGELVQVKAIQDRGILLADGRIIPENYRTFTHGYAVTSHAAQGNTADEVLLVVSSRSLAAVHQEQFYVSISRGRERCQIFTDDAVRLRSHVTRSSVRLAALEVAPRARRSKFVDQILRRGNRFLKQFRLRFKQSLLLRSEVEQSSRPPYEHQRRSHHRVST